MSLEIVNCLLIMVAHHHGRTSWQKAVSRREPRSRVHAWSWEGGYLCKSPSPGWQKANLSYVEIGGSRPVKLL